MILGVRHRRRARSHLHLGRGRYRHHRHQIDCRQYLVIHLQRPREHCLPRRQRLADTLLCSLHCSIPNLRHRHFGRQLRRTQAASHPEPASWHYYLIFLNQQS